MQKKPYLQIVLLIAAMQCLSAYKFRCYWFCTDQTAIQSDYVVQRDECRRYAQLRVETDTANPELIDGKARQAKLISLFSGCMSDKGWSVPDGKGSQQPAGPVPVPTPSAPPPIAAQEPAPATVPKAAIATQAELQTMQENRVEKQYLARLSECSFARHSAAYSSVAATRAEACDIECAQRLKTNPKGKRPAACPPE